ncbi:MAG: phospholipase D-like domain-containing protein [Pararhodobacter sp.]
MAGTMLRVLLPGLSVMFLLGAVGCATSPQVSGRHAAAGQPLSRLFLDDLGPAPEASDHLFGHPRYPEVTLALQSRARSRLALALRCDGPARLHRRGANRDPVDAPAWAPAGTSLTTTLPPQARIPRTIDLGPEVTRCRLDVTPAGSPAYSLVLRRDPGLAALTMQAATDAAGVADARAAGGNDPLAAVMAAGRALSMTPLAPAGPMRLLTTGEDAFAARIEALTGRPVPHEALLAGDPAMPLDFSNAPRLESIYLSYFYMNADFAGALMARMLAWHAARGTEVRILLSDTVMGAPERALFEGLAARFPNIHLQNYRFAPRRGDGLEDHVARLHRSNHAKIFLTSAHDPTRSVAIVGGRNWHESYLFSEPRDLSAFPALRQYVPGRHRSLVDFLPFDDVELAFSAPGMIQGIGDQFRALWHRDLTLAPIAARRPVEPRTRNRVLARHFLSMPYLDGRAQEALFIDLIDASRGSIQIASPFINPSEGILAALDRALGRGVAVRLVTTMQMPGLDGVFITGLAHEFAEGWADRIEMIDFGRDPQALHAKLYVFDDRLAVVGSVNLNRRSFYHDIENGVMVLDSGFARQVASVIDGFARQGNRVTRDTATPRRASLLMRMRWLRRAF